MIVTAIITFLNLPQQVISVVGYCLTVTQNHERILEQLAWTNARQREQTRWGQLLLQKYWSLVEGDGWKRLSRSKERRRSRGSTSRSWCSSISSPGAPKQRSLATTNRSVLAFSNSCDHSWNAIKNYRARSPAKLKVKEDKTEEASIQKTRKNSDEEWKTTRWNYSSWAWTASSSSSSSAWQEWNSDETRERSDWQKPAEQDNSTQTFECSDWQTPADWNTSDETREHPDWRSYVDWHSLKHSRDSSDWQPPIDRSNPIEWTWHLAVAFQMATRRRRTSFSRTFARASMTTIITSVCDALHLVRHLCHLSRLLWAMWDLWKSMFSALPFCDRLAQDQQVIAHCVISFMCVVTRKRFHWDYPCCHLTDLLSVSIQKWKNLAVPVGFCPVSTVFSSRAVHTERTDSTTTFFFLKRLIRRWMQLSTKCTPLTWQWEANGGKQRQHQATKEDPHQNLQQHGVPARRGRRRDWQHKPTSSTTGGGRLAAHCYRGPEGQTLLSPWPTGSRNWRLPETNGHQSQQPAQRDEPSHMHQRAPGTLTLWLGAPAPERLHHARHTFDGVVHQRSLEIRAWCPPQVGLPQDKPESCAVVAKDVEWTATPAVARGRGLQNGVFWCASSVSCWTSSLGSSTTGPRGLYTVESVPNAILMESSSCRRNALTWRWRRRSVAPMVRPTSSSMGSANERTGKDWSALVAVVQTIEGPPCLPRVNPSGSSGNQSRRLVLWHRILVSDARGSTNPWGSGAPPPRASVRRWNGTAALRQVPMHGPGGIGAPGRKLGAVHRMKHRQCE